MTTNIEVFAKVQRPIRASIEVHCVVEYLQLLRDCDGLRLCQHWCRQGRIVEQCFRVFWPALQQYPRVGTGRWKFGDVGIHGSSMAQNDQ